MDVYKKPVKVQALALTWDTWSEMCEFAGVGAESDQPRGVWCDKETGTWTMRAGLNSHPSLGLVIPTPEGDLLAIEGDYVVKDRGNLAPCPAARFEADYTSTPPEVLHYDDETMFKVLGVLDKVRSDTYKGQDIIGQLQNAGILFRERSRE